MTPALDRLCSDIVCGISPGLLRTIMEERKQSFDLDDQAAMLHWNFEVRLDARDRMEKRATEIVMAYLQSDPRGQERVAEAEAEEAEVRGEVAQMKAREKVTA